MKYLTIVYNLPSGFDVSTLTQHEFASAFAWSHKMDECNDLKAALEKANASTASFERDDIAKLRQVLKAAVELTCSPAWAGVSDEDCELERVLRECGYVTAND